MQQGENCEDGASTSKCYSSVGNGRSQKAIAWNAFLISADGSSPLATWRLTVAKKKYAMDMTEEELDAYILSECEIDTRTVEVEPPPEKPGAESKNFELDSEFLVRCECSQCGEIAEEFGNVGDTDLGDLQKKFRKDLYREGWRRIFSEGMWEDFCDVCVKWTPIIGPRA